MSTLSPLAQRAYDVLVTRMTTIDMPYVPLCDLELAIKEQAFGSGGAGWTALAELHDAGLIEIIRDFRYRLTPLAWQSLLAADRARAEQKAREWAELLQDRDRIATLLQQAVRERDDKHAAWMTANAEAAALRQSLEGCKRLSDSVVDETDIIDMDWIGQEVARALNATDAGQALLEELAALEEKNAAWEAIAGEMADVIRALRSALEPFARFASKYASVVPDEAHVTALVVPGAPTLGDLRRAREALKEPPCTSRSILICDGRNPEGGACLARVEDAGGARASVCRKAHGLGWETRREKGQIWAWCPECKGRKGKDGSSRAG